MIWAESLLQVSLPSGIAKNCYPCIESFYCHLQLTVSPSPTQRGQWERRLARYTGWSGPPEWEGWEVKLGYCSPHPFCTSIPSCLLVFLHKLSHSTGSWLQGWSWSLLSAFHHEQELQEVEISGQGKAGSWVNQKRHRLFSGAADILQVLQAQGVLACDAHVNPSPTACSSGWLPCANYIFPCSEDDLTHWELIWGPLSASPIKPRTAVCTSQESGHHKSPPGQFPELLHLMYLQISSHALFEGLMPNAFWRNWKKWSTAVNAVRHCDG